MSLVRVLLRRYDKLKRQKTDLKARFLQIIEGRLWIIILIGDVLACSEVCLYNVAARIA